MNKNILFLVTGMTPQIITETIWALACDPQNLEKWIPDEIHVLSTQDGLNQIQKRLLNDCVFQKFQCDYPQLAHIQFSDSFLHVIKDDKNQVLTDLKTPEDNEFAANMICEKIRTFTKSDQISLHVSIAGGRKTMGFYAGYALSLYGRAQDRMSHVLVEDKFEKATNFFYPTPSTFLAVDRDEKVVGDAKDAVVWLATIPFIRMRDAILPKHQLKQDDDFISVVNKINESYKDVKLQINVHNRKVCVNDKFFIDDLSPREFALFYWFASLRKDGKVGVIAPTKNMTNKDIGKEELDHIRLLTADFINYYQDLKNSEQLDISVDKNFLNSVKSQLETSLQEVLGLELAAKISITQESRGKHFYLDLHPDAIEIVDNFNNTI